MLIVPKVCMCVCGGGGKTSSLEKSQRNETRKDNAEYMIPPKQWEFPPKKRLWVLKGVIGLIGVGWETHSPQALSLCLQWV